MQILVNLYGLTISYTEVVNTSTSDSTSTINYYILIVLVVLVLVLVLYIVYYYKTRKVLYITGIANEVNITDIQSLLPGTISVSNHIIIFDTNTSAQKNYVKCNTTTVTYRHSKITLKWKSIFSNTNTSSDTSNSSGCSCCIKEKKGSNTNGYKDFHGFLIPIPIDMYEHKLQDNTHTLVEGRVDTHTLVEGRVNNKMVREV